MWSLQIDGMMELFSWNAMRAQREWLRCAVGNVVCGVGFNCSQRLRNKSQIVRKCGIYVFIYMPFASLSPLCAASTVRLASVVFVLFICMVWYSIFNYTIFGLPPSPAMALLCNRKLPRCSFAKFSLFPQLLFRLMPFGDNYFRHYLLHWSDDFHHIYCGIMQKCGNENVNLLKFNFFLLVFSYKTFAWETSSRKRVIKELCNDL